MGCYYWSGSELAGVAKLADASALGADARKGMQVQFLSPAPTYFYSFIKIPSILPHQRMCHGMNEILGKVHKDHLCCKGHSFLYSASH